MIKTTIVLSLLILAVSAKGAETRYYNSKGQYVGRAIEFHGRTNYFDSRERFAGHSTFKPQKQSFYKQGK